MRLILPLLFAGLIAAWPASARDVLGQFGRWGAFREPPGRCFAMAEPVSGGTGRPFVAISRVRHGGPPRLHVVPSRTPGSDMPLRLEIGDRRFTLAGSGGRDAREDQRIVAALRAADRLRVIGVDQRGRRFRDDYALAGAPSAIDAAIVGCA